MERKRGAVGLLCLFSSFGATATQPDVAIDTQRITTGSEIHVLEPGPDLQTIINDISDEGPDKPYLIRLGPGEYAIAASNGFGLVMKPYVSIVGSGEDVSILTGAISSGSADSSSAIVTGASNTILTDLSVENTGGGSRSIAIYNSAANPRLERVTATATGADNNYGIYNADSSPLMIEVTAAASRSGNSSNFGVYNFSSGPTMTEVNASASSGTNNYGVYNFTSLSLTMTEGTATASTGETNYGVFNAFSSPTISEVIVAASGGSTDNFGLYNDDATSSPQIWRSTVSGTSKAVQITGSTGTRIIDTQLEGGIDTDPAGNQCRNAFDENLDVVSC